MNKEETKKEIKELRIKCDGLAQLCKELRPFGKPKEGEDIITKIYKSNTTKEIEKAVDNLYLAKAWSGKILNVIGYTSPYSINDGNRKTTKDIKDTADKSDYNNFKCTFISLSGGSNAWTRRNHIGKVDYIREYIQRLIKETDDFSKEFNEIELEQGFVYKYLTEARFWLGFELQRIKENEKRKNS